MKTLKLFCLAIISLIVFSSCDNDETSPSDQGLVPGTISAKWEINNRSEFTSFEFNESGSYIIRQTIAPADYVEDVLYFGQYEIIDEETIDLHGYGILSNVQLSNNEISFTLRQTNSETDIELVASKAEEMESTQRTSLLCKTWKLVSIDGQSIVGTEMDLTVLFSKAGTYLVQFKYSSEDFEGGLAHWRWANKNEEQIQYDWQETPDWESPGLVDIRNLTSNSLTIVEEDMVYELSAVEYSSSAKLSVSKESSSRKKTGVFSK
ncbi:hypothetical protein KMW28_03580 [Flammeovirga yaeyamensis]|uniref:Lipoprotein n=1 Tax=Flammeovirga yaeyamensis TaxID=367791 RepID=A0AAX1N546_9BACT|nr:hypothetical protein [Flammeovirga yaeyamensis]MBB3701272.1 hypothetical protein [Flammeovirga yaeyamensis]NMF38258.1 hypothetical protein [Flammeovirga yaeyamensis]QWG02669.1 hypothetical protein KMW28_03580 [Flammeovirga yaeyamensis]